MIGKTIGRYQILSEIGRGGMAVVYLGEDPSFHRQVAIKVLPTQFLENILLRARFEREARIIATLEHPAIVPVHDFGEQDGQLYLVMRYMPGGSLAQRISKGALPPAEAIDILTRLAPALDAVHARGIVHRDLKPGNILFDAFGNPALSDFGIAQFTEATVDLTGDAVIGTPSYMSPEQVRADADIDGRSDLYALGVILFEMLTGRQPYRAATPLSVAMKHLTDPVPRIHSLHPQFPPALDAILAKAMAKTPEERYARAADLAADLRSLPDMPLAAPGATQLDVEQAAGEGATLPDSAPQPASIAVSAPPQPGSPLQPAQAKPLSGQPAIPRRAVLYSLSAGGVLVVVGLCAALILAIVAYQSGMFAGLFPRASTPAASPTASVAALETQAPAPTDATSSATQPAAAAVLLSDDFSNAASGWPQGPGDGANYMYKDGAYHLAVDTSDTLYWASPAGTFSDTSVSVQAGVATGGGESYFGVLCRIQDSDNLYYLVVRVDGYFTIGKIQNGSFSALLPAGWSYNGTLADAPKPYTLRADCAGSNLSLYLGDTLLGQAQDSTFTSGELGLAVAAVGPGERMEIIFDNLVVREVK